jgi:hypothetical protein
MLLLIISFLINVITYNGITYNGITYNGISYNVKPYNSYDGITNKVTIIKFDNGASIMAKKLYNICPCDRLDSELSGRNFIKLFFSTSLAVGKNKLERLSNSSFLG